MAEFYREAGLKELKQRRGRVLNEGQMHDDRNTRHGLRKHRHFRMAPTTHHQVLSVTRDNYHMYRAEYLAQTAVSPSINAELSKLEATK
ncbi:unnamed protein product [Dovyalis caffra]|uniref:Uncharacterized protein n=1 Tax=Dovyalis caffra TaxID=77055 RepID=A0AAV1RG73_9ROSI|nr:unnamed protein product [Dovyalis caffra]